MNNRKFVVYCHTNKINGKRYVGITSQKPEKRWGNGCNYKDNPHFYNAIKKYGWEEFYHEILFTNLNSEEAKEKEIELIAKWNLTDRAFGYNRSPGGDLMSEESILKMSKSCKGRKLSNETKLKMSFSRTGNKHWAAIPVAQYTSDGIKINEYSNSLEAMRCTGIEARNIRSCIHGKRKHAGGFLWIRIDKRR